MSSVYFEQFESLWKRVEEKFVSEAANESFTLDNLRNHLISQNLLTNQTSLESIETKFLQRVGLAKPTDNLKLPDSIFSALNKYVSIGEVSDSPAIADSKTLDELVRELAKNSVNKTPPKQSFSEIGFLGRKNELSELESFLLSSERRIFALYGVPMIGKSKLVSYFLEINETAKTYQIITVKLNPRPESAEQRIKDEIFGDKEFNDFSGFSSDTIIVVQNFEETLKWTGDPQEVHDIKDEYANIKTFLEKAAEISSIKLILESRFQIHFQLFLDEWRAKVKILPGVQLKGVEKDEFWQFYELKGFSYEQFEQLCKNFDNHTGLLALAYNDVEFLYQNRLIEAYYEPTVVTRLLWNLVERIIDRLENREIWILCALTFLQEPVRKENLYENFLTLPDFEDELQIGDSFNSLANKLLVQLEKGLYDLNPYIREVCYTFLKGRRRSQMQTIENLSYFKDHGKTPYYDEIRLAHGRGDYLFLLRLGQKLRKEGKYKDAINILETSLDINPKKEVVLNEIAITYKWQEEWEKAIETLKRALEYDEDNVIVLNELAICYRENHQLDKAIETLEKAKEKHPNDAKTLNELGICYRENQQLDKAIETLEKAVELGNIHSYNELAICYRENRQLDKAIEILEKAVELGNIHSYNELAICYRENNQLKEAIETLEKAVEDYPDNVKILNELGICYRENKDYKNSIAIAEKAIKLGNYPSYTVLIITYEEMGDTEKAYEVAQRGVKDSNWKDNLLIKQLRELEKILAQQKQENESIKKLKVFLSYSHDDEDIKKELDKHLSALKRSDKISTWNDRKLPAGAKWDKTIQAELENADIVLLLISANFINSDYIWNIEIKKAIENHEKGKSVVIPIFCKDCDFDDMPFAKLQGLPNDAKFITSQANKDQAYTEVAKGIRKIVESRLS